MPQAPDARELPVIDGEIHFDDVLAVTYHRIFERVFLAGMGFCVALFGLIAPDAIPMFEDYKVFDWRLVPALFDFEPRKPSPKPEAAEQERASGQYPNLEPVDGYEAHPRAVQAVEFALRQLGKPYQWGAQGPNRYDCSGLVLASYQSVGETVPRVAADQYWGTRDKLVTRSAGSVGTFAHAPTERRKRALGRRSSKSMPPFSMILFQRFTPFSQSRM